MKVMTKCGLGVICCLMVAGVGISEGALSGAQKAVIGRKIWHNECGGTVDGLTTWNTGEDFPSLGIGHFIWYPEGKNGPFEESWPAWVAFAKQRGSQLPGVARLEHSPWKSKKAFYAAFQGHEMVELRAWLKGTVALQTEFIMARSRAALAKMLAAAPSSDRERIASNYHHVSSTPQGMYALIDYVNFKGEGIEITERYQGRGWGLLQVLGEMKSTSDGPAAAIEFSQAARRVLTRRVQLSPVDRSEKRWLAGWLARCQTYAKPL
jgi:hypothetical protein